MFVGRLVPLLAFLSVVSGFALAPVRKVLYEYIGNVLKVILLSLLCYHFPAFNERLGIEWR